MGVTAVEDSVEGWPELAGLDAALAAQDDDCVQHYRDALSSAASRMHKRFEDGAPVGDLVLARARFVDGILLRAWRRTLPRWLDRLSLIAVGGYGRGQLHPASDIDVLILVDRSSGTRPWKEDVEQFVTLLWDMGLEAGHSVRTLADCVTESRADLSVATSLMEARLLCGSQADFDSMREMTGPARIWPSRQFFEAKLAEQQARHLRYHDTGYNLEPNVKGSPGGLRDIQMIGWVAKRHFGADTFRGLVDEGFLTIHEYNTLAEGREFLWRIRYALHVLTGRGEERLLFDHQLVLAQRFGYKDLPHTLAVEQLMQKYYRTVLKLSRMNEMLLQLFREAILVEATNATPINERFQELHGNIDALRDDVFESDPCALLEVFLLVQQHTGVNGVTARTIRLIRRSRNLIDASFRNDPRNQRTFLAIMSASQGVTHELRRMNRYGVLGRYIPAFGRIVGRMQFDLFHAYTVDAHTLFVVSNLRRFALQRFDHEFPYCSQIMQLLPKPELAYLAGLFHDIAKGRGGDHSELGARDAEAFCLKHGFRPYDARLVAWLVRHHLELSVTAQKKDINDPQVVNEFAAVVGDQLHLDYLYVLTVADVRATNPKLFNSWKAQLFEKLYRQTRRALDRGLENPIGRSELIQENRTQAERLLCDAGVDESSWHSAWNDLGDDYFLRHSAREILWHTEQLAALRDNTGSLVAVRPSDKHGDTLILWYAPRANFGFARATAVFDELGLTILDARITTTTHGYSLDTYRVMETTDEPMADDHRLANVEQALRKALDAKEAPRVTRRAHRQVRSFTTPTQIDFVVDLTSEHTVMELTAADRPGLLSKVGLAFREAEVEVSTAKITTVGERAEDVFFLTDRRGNPLGDKHCGLLQDRLMERLGGRQTSA